MKIALPSNENIIDSHFGHCDHFTVYTINDKKEIIAEEIFASPAGCGCKSNIASTLSLAGVKVMLAGNMGDGAVNVLQSNGIQVIRGCAGDIRSVAEKFLSGQVFDSGIGCNAHDHNCGSH